MSLKRKSSKYSDSGVNGRTVPEPARTITSESAIKPRKKAKRESKDSSLSSTSNPEIFSAKSKSENTVCSPQSSTAASGPTELVSDLDSESSSAISTSSSDDKGDDESIDDLRETGSEESSEDLESSDEEDIGRSATSSIETDSDPDEVVTLRPGKKPKMRPPSTRKSNSLLKRLQAFLPELQNANQELEQDRIEGRLEQRRMENVDEGEERVIEMDLELGVLENKKRCHGVGSNDEEAAEDAEDAEVGSGIDILGRLMGREPKSFSIDEVE